MEGYEFLRLVPAAILVIAGSVMDIRHRKVAVLLPVFFLLAGIAANGYLLYAGKTTLETWILSASVGICMLLLAAVFRGLMGYGDGLVVLAMGMYLRWEQVFISTCIGIFLMAIGCGLLLVIRKADRKTKIPFLPFLAAGFFLTEILIK